MLSSLHVKNLALVEEAEIEFEKGLNIITGETGAGKSIILGSISLALGGKQSGSVIGKHGDFALIELTFTVDDNKLERLKDMDIIMEDNDVLIQRKILPTKSIFKINGETVNAQTVRKITGILIDIHGQHEHQSLLYKTKHLEILDEYARNELAPYKEELLALYKDYQNVLHSLESFNMNEDERLRKISFITYEINEIEDVGFKENEDVTLEEEYKKISNSRKILEQLEMAHEAVGSDNFGSASSLISKALNAVSSVSAYDKQISELLSQIVDIDNLLSDFNRDMSSYISDLEFDSGRFEELEKRIDQLNSLKAKYGRTYEDVMNYSTDRQAELEILNEYEVNKNKALKEKDNLYNKIEKIADSISEIRKKAAAELEKDIIAVLKDLNFLEVRFAVNFNRTAETGKNGFDDTEFIISTNPGEDMKPLAQVASGGELSRIMLGIKTVLADRDDVETLIFDEIDSGISGRTAQKVSEKLKGLSKGHQIICITHLPQIAAMADTHFMIEKNIVEGKTVTSVNKLDYDNSVKELARLLGGSVITDAVLENASEMKRLAKI